MILTDLEELTELLLSVNYDHGEIPELSGYDRNQTPLLAWLNESGGDDVLLRTVALGGEDAAQSEPIETEPADLKYPITFTPPPNWTWLA